MSLSKCENFLAILIGKQFVMDYQEQTMLFVFKRFQLGDESYEYDQWMEYCCLNLADIADFGEVCSQFSFI